MLRPARLATLLIAVVAAVLAVAACGDDGGGDAAETSGGGAFPVTIDHRLGSATIEAPPTRVVALGQTDPETALALGVTPVGLREAFTGGVEPWIADALRSAEPELLNVNAGVPFEKVAALRPDLILAGDLFSMDQATYDRLAAIAPTVAYRTETAEDSWQDNALTIGRALGREAEAERLVADVEGRIAAEAEAHPEFAGTTFSFSNHYEPGALVTLQDGPVVDVFEGLGLQVTPAVAELPQSDTSAGNADLSLERLATLDADVVLMVYGQDALREQLEANPIYRRLDAVRRGDDVFVPFVLAIALRSPSALSLPWSLDRLVPELERALS
jgi:iron complex transport system substrate-binding protein